MSTRCAGGHYDATYSARRERAAEDRVQVPEASGKVLKTLDSCRAAEAATQCRAPAGAAGSNATE